ncbi:hypothetical protein COB72_00350 [bacterium]|nr:MAG: hypothetical protein COB72_00350 [bacterium]
MTAERKLSKKAMTVLELIGEGYSYSQIVDAHSEITYRDIFRAAEDALSLIESSLDYQTRIEKIKREYPNAYEKWSTEDDVTLAEMSKNGIDILTMARHFRRQPSALRSRIAKLGLNQRDQ